jgi:hemerythrin-like domain-containing protein
MEHDEGRVHVRAIEEAARKAIDGETGQAVIIAEHAKGYAALLRGHIEKEDDILYPLAERVLPEEVRSRMLVAYKQAEAKTPDLEERYRRLVEDYEVQGAA